MRKSIAISLLLVYILSTAVVGIRAHYSAGTLRSIDLMLTPAPASQAKKGNPCKVQVKEEVICARPQVHVVRTTTYYHAPLREVLNYADKISHGYIRIEDDNSTSPMCDIPVVEKDSAACGC